MKCIVAMVVTAIVVANEAGLERMNPWLATAVGAVLMWGAFKLVDEIKI